jgi:hypothetical protein
MTTPHLRHRLHELRNTLRWLRTLSPDGQRYKLWLGDLVEWVHDAFGPGSPQMARVRGVLTDRPRPPRDADETARRLDYLDRLSAFARLLDELGRELREPITLIELDGGDPHARLN